MPTTAKQLRSQLGLNNKIYGYIPDKITNMLPTWHKIGKPSPLFTKIGDQEVDKLRTMYGGQQEINNQTAIANKTPDEITSLEAAITKQVSRTSFFRMKIFIYICIYNYTYINNTYSYMCIF